MLSAPPPGSSPSPCQPRSSSQAIAGALAGMTGGYGLFTAANQGANASQPPAWWLITAVLGTLISGAGLTAMPARLAARPPIAETLQADGS